jgi:aspartate/glutamate racemase
MIKQGSFLAESEMRFYRDKCKAGSISKLENNKKQTKRVKQLIEEELADEQDNKPV